MIYTGAIIMAQQDIPATFDQLKIGTRVKCIFQTAVQPNERYGKTGTVIALNPNVAVNAITIKWDDDTAWNTNWGKPSSFTIIDDSTAAIPGGALRLM